MVIITPDATNLEIRQNETPNNFGMFAKHPDTCFLLLSS